MPIDRPVTAINDEPDKVVPIDCNCDLLWSLAHQFSYLRLSDPIEDNTYTFVKLFAARAKRIAATYARFYLETEEGGDAAKRGRHYWMALGAFASKTVACLLDSWQVQAQYTVFRTTGRGLAKGNLWLFFDIATSHWLYNNYQSHFTEGMACHPIRNASTLELGVKETLESLPYAGAALSELTHFHPSPDIIEGFALTAQIEEAIAQGWEEDVQGFQMDQLLAIAKHEQGAVLQKLIYDDEGFSGWVKAERVMRRGGRLGSWLGSPAAIILANLLPTYELIFTEECTEGDDDLKSVAPDDMHLEEFDSRMEWIVEAAEQFHGLMETSQPFMEGKLQIIAGWVNSPDAQHVY